MLPVLAWKVEVGEQHKVGALERPVWVENESNSNFQIQEQRQPGKALS
jgi:hypothetical protein